MWYCPNCRRAHLDDDKVCKCEAPRPGEQQVASPSPSQGQMSRSETLIATLVIVGLIVLILGGGIGIGVWRYSSSGSKPHPSADSPLDPRVNGIETSELVSVAQGFVKNSLKVPSTAKFPWGSSEYVIQNLGNGEFGVAGWVEAKNAYGVPLKQQWTVFVSRTPNGTWQLKDIKFSDG
jgi:hypothetical protein